MVQLDKIENRFKEGESFKAYTCRDFCIENGRQHIHEFESTEDIKDGKDKGIRKIKADESKKIYTYECSCLYFWEKFLKFFGDFSDDQKKMFSSCKVICDDKTHIPKEYCILPLWHDLIKGNSVPKDKDGVWVCKGHIFKCNHPIGL